MQFGDGREPDAASSSSGNLVDELFRTQLSGVRLPAGNREFLRRKLVGLLREREFPCQRWRNYDKAFACAWLSDAQVAVGTKCNRLLLINADPRRFPEIPLVREVPLPSPPDRPDPTNPNNSIGVREALWSIQNQMAEHSSGSSAGSATEDRESIAQMLARAFAGLDDEAVQSHAPVTNVMGEIQVPNCGIHTLSVSPCGTRLATGGSNPNDCQIFRLTEQTNGAISLQQSHTLVGHKDWLFGSAWVTNHHIVTGSRDRHLKLWSLHSSSNRPIRRALHTHCIETGKVRDVKFMDCHHLIVSLSSYGAVTYWDSHLYPVQTVHLPSDREVVCLAVSDHLVATGSQNIFTLLDPRQQGTIVSHQAPDYNHSIRSVAFSQNLLSIAGGKGRIKFYDLRMGRYLNMGDLGLETECKFESCHLQTGAGYLYRNRVYLDHFTGMEIRNACYAHVWNPRETKILTVGGPLAFGLTGCYMGIWE